MSFKVGDRVKLIGQVNAIFTNKTATITKIEHEYYSLDYFTGPGMQIVTNSPYDVKTTSKYIKKINSSIIRERLGIT